MAEVNQIIDTLKQLLKEKNVNQADVSAVLNLGLARGQSNCLPTTIFILVDSATLANAVFYKIIKALIL